jgi:hypothetical protein
MSQSELDLILEAQRFAAPEVNQEEDDVHA